MFLLEKSGPDRAHRFIRSAPESALTLNSPTASYLVSGITSSPGRAPSAPSAPPSCLGAPAPRPHSRNLGTPEKLYADPPARFPLDAESSFQMPTTCLCPAEPSQPPAASHTHLGPRRPPRSIRHLPPTPPGRLHPRGRALSDPAPAGAPGPSARSSARRADWRRPPGTRCVPPDAGVCSNHSPLRGARARGPGPGRLRWLRGPRGLPWAAGAPGPGQRERASASEERARGGRRRSRRAPGGRSGAGDCGPRWSPAVSAWRGQLGEPLRLGHLPETRGGLLERQPLRRQARTHTRASTRAPPPAPSRQMESFAGKSRGAGGK